MFKIRCSQIGKIMGKRGLGKTGESVAREWLIEQTFNRRKEFSNKFTEKGLIVEDDSIDLVAEHFDYGFLIKNEKFYSNEFLTGTPDLVLKDFVIDIKSSWDVFTFPLFNEELNSDYYYQVQGYMALTGLKKASVVYVLTDTPKHLIEREAYYFCKNQGMDELEMDVYDEFEKRMTFSDIPLDKRIKRYDVEYSHSDVDLIYERVKECREYLDELVK